MAHRAPEDNMHGEVHMVHHNRPRKSIVIVTLGILPFITVGNYLAVGSLAYLISHHPLWLVALNPQTKYLALVANRIDLIVYLLVAIPRRMLPHPLWFLVGRWYGDSGIVWVKRRLPDIGMIVEQLESWFPRFGWLIVLLYPHPVVCAMAGASAMGFLAFLIYALVGIVFFVVMASVFGDIFHGPISGVTTFTTKYWIPLTVISVLLSAYLFWSNSKLQSASQMEAELEQVENTKQSGPATGQPPTNN